jgi:hypothetical protein
VRVRFHLRRFAAFVVLVGLVEVGDVAVGSWSLVFESRGVGTSGGGGFERWGAID